MSSERFRLADPDAPFAERYSKQFHSGHDVESVPHALISNADWMIGNTVLAYIPLGLAWLLFVRGLERVWTRWIVAAAFVAFLPNALYVTTDLIHLEAEGDTLSWSVAVFLALVPVYALFVLAGMVAYSASLSLVYRWARGRCGLGVALAAVVLLHLACCCGIYLGRVLRLNSWEFVTDPYSVLEGVIIMATRSEALAYVMTMLVAGGLLTLATAPLRRRLIPLTSL